jgi:hypothetical protein
MLAFHNEKMSVVEKAEDDAAEEAPQQDAPKNASGVKM